MLGLYPVSGAAVSGGIVYLRPVSLTAFIGKAFIAAGLRRALIAGGVKRNFIARGPQNVAICPDLSPPIDEGEEEFATFDFGLDLANGAAIASIAGVTCECVYGTDPAASSRILNAPAIGVSPGTSAANAAVVVLVGNMTGKCRYRLQCLVSTSDGQTLSKITHLPCNS